MLNFLNLQKCSYSLLNKNEVCWLLKAAMEKLSIRFLLLTLKAITTISIRSEKCSSFVKGSRNGYKNCMYICWQAKMFRRPVICSLVPKK